MCARRKERSDGIAIATKSIASSCPARRALPNGKWGKHVRKGDIYFMVYKRFLFLFGGNPCFALGAEEDVIYVYALGGADAVVVEGTLC